MTIFYCLKFNIPPNVEGQILVFYHPEQGDPGTGFPFRRPPTTRRATDRIESTVSNGFSTVSCVSVATIRLLSRYLAADNFF
jgi:hypothetical protein